MPFKIEEVKDFKEFKRRMKDLEMESRWRRGGKVVFLFNLASDKSVNKVLADGNKKAGDGDIIWVKISSDVWKDSDNPFKSFPKLKVPDLPYACLFYRKVLKDSGSDGKKLDSKLFGEILKACVDYKEPNKTRERAEKKAEEEKAARKTPSGGNTPKKGNSDQKVKGNVTPIKDPPKKDPAKKDGAKKGGETPKKDGPKKGGETPKKATSKQKANEKPRTRTKSRDSRK